MHPDLILVFTRYPEPGKVKTRLIAALGQAGAASLHQRLTAHILLVVKAFTDTGHTDLVVSFDGGRAQAMQRLFGGQYHYQPQASGDLGQRMASAFAASLTAGRRRVVLIGSDCPGISAPILSSAFALLIDHNLVLGPATDGGYYLIGLKALHPELFQDIPWGTSEVLAQTLAQAAVLGLQTALLEPLTDIDRPEDLPVWDNFDPPCH